MEIVKVRFVNHTTGQPEGREYSYFTEEALVVGDHVKAPTRSGFNEGIVTATAVPEEAIAAFRNAVKTIPAGSIMVRPAPEIPPAAVVEHINEAASLAAEEAAQDNIQGRLVVDEKASAEAGTLVGDIVPNGPQANQEAPGTAEGDWKDVKPLGPIFDTSPDAPPAIDPENIPDLGPFPSVLALVKVKTDDDLAVYQLFQEGVRLKEFAQARVIATAEDLKPATNDLAIIAKLKKALEAKRVAYVKPIRAKLDAVNNAFATLLAPFEEADRLTRSKVGTFDTEQRKRAAEAKRIEDEKARLAREEAQFNGTGEITVPLGTVEQVAPPPEHTRTDLGTQGMRDNWKARVVDFALLPDEYKLANESLLNAKARTTKGQGKVPGVEFYNDRTVTVRTK